MWMIELKASDERRERDGDSKFVRPNLLHQHRLLCHSLIFAQLPACHAVAGVKSIAVLVP